MGIVAVTASACGTIPPQMISGDNLSTEHGTARVMDAFKGAQEYCAARGKQVATIRSDCPSHCISVYKCVTE